MRTRPQRFRSMQALVVAGLLLGAVAQAQVLLDDTALIGLPSVAAPAEYTFTPATPESLVITITDLQTPAPLSALQLAVTQAGAVVGTASLASGATSAAVTLASASGSLGLHVLGTPTGGAGLGSFSICVALPAAPAACLPSGVFSGNIQAPAAATPSGQSMLSTSFTSTVAGAYTVTLTDDAFPVALGTLSALINQGAGSPLAIIQPGTPATVSLAAATSYNLFAVAAADPTVLAGLYGLQVTDPNGQVVFGHTFPVGSLGSSTIVANTSAQALQLAVTDQGFPAPLAGVGAAVTLGATALATETTSGTTAAFTAPAGNLELWRYALPASPSTGVYTLAVTSAAATLYTATEVAQAPDAATATSFAYVVNLPAAGNYSVTLTDFQVPPLQSLGPATVAQNGAALTVGAGGVFAAGAGPLVVVVPAQAATGTAGLFSVTVTQSGVAAPLLAQTQPVGGAFHSQVINVGASGTYTASLADLGFPAKFASLSAVLSVNGQVIGKSFGGGSFNFNATAGQQLLLSLVATPGPPAYGLYWIDVVPAPPSVVLSASAASVTAGQPVQLTWSSSGATSCSASGATGWSGNEATSGTLGLTIDATVTLVLSCTGAGGTASQSVKVTAVGTVPPPSSSTGSGGGSTDPLVLWILGGLAGIARLRRQR